MGALCPLCICVGSLIPSLGYISSIQQAFVFKPFRYSECSLKTLLHCSCCFSVPISGILIDAFQHRPRRCPDICSYGQPLEKYRPGYDWVAGRRGQMSHVRPRHPCRVISSSSCVIFPTRYKIISGAVKRFAATVRKTAAETGSLYAYTL